MAKLIEAPAINYQAVWAWAVKGSSYSWGICGGKSSVFYNCSSCVGACLQHLGRAPVDPELFLSANVAEAPNPSRRHQGFGHLLEGLLKAHHLEWYIIVVLFLWTSLARLWMILMLCQGSPFIPPVHFSSFIVNRLFQRLKRSTCQDLTLKNCAVSPSS